MPTAARHFTIAEADALIPALEHHFGKVMRLRAQMRGIYEELERLGALPGTVRELADGSEPTVVAARGRFRALAEAIGDEIALVEQLGGAVKDLELGLVDFLAEVGGEEVWLCWQYGDKRIGWYHGLDEGFAARRPLRARPGAGAMVLH